MTAFAEEVVPGFSYSYTGELLHAEQSPFQRIEIYEHPSFGRVLVLDGLVQTTTEDEFIYHEMLTHVPMLSHASPRRVLVIGGGDGGTLRHVLMHPAVERAVMVEIDERVSSACREYQPSIGAGVWDDPRAEIRYEDGLAFVRDTDERFDVILIDSSDPVGPGEGLFTAEFYAAARARLLPGGILCAQSGSPYFQQGELHRAYANISAAFGDARVYVANVPTYPGSIWTFTMAGEAISIDASDAAARAEAAGLTARYWAPELHAGCFGVPRIVHDVIAEGGPPHTWGLSPEERARRAGAGT